VFFNRHVVRFQGAAKAGYSCKEKKGEKRARGRKRRETGGEGRGAIIGSKVERWSYRLSRRSKLDR
jgi:hypothetical protein